MNIPKTNDEANGLLRRECEIAAQLEKIEGQLNSEITRAKAKADEAAAPLKKERGVLETALKTWFRTARKTIEGSSIRLFFGRIIARPKRKVTFVSGTTEEGAVDALLGLAEQVETFYKFVRVTKELNRAAIHEATDEEKARIAQCGVVFDPGETVSVEPDLEALEKEAVSR